MRISEPLSFLIGIADDSPFRVFFNSLLASSSSSFSLTNDTISSFSPFPLATFSREMLCLCCSASAMSSAFFLLTALAIPAAPPATEPAAAIPAKIGIRGRKPPSF